MSFKLLYKHISGLEIYIIRNFSFFVITVKIPAPQILLATYIEDAEESFMSIQHNHDYVKNPLFQVKIFSESTVPILVQTPFSLYV